MQMGQMERVKGEWDNGKWVKRMDSALSLLQGLPRRGGLLAAASRRKGFLSCSCFGSLCSPERLAKEQLIEFVSFPLCPNEQVFLDQTRESNAFGICP